MCICLITVYLNYLDAITPIPTAIATVVKVLYNFLFFFFHIEVKLWGIIYIIQLFNYKCTFPFPVSLNLSDEGKQIGINSSLLNLGFNVGFARRLAPKKLSIEFLLMKSLNPNLFDNH